MKKSDIFFRNRETLDQGNQIFSVGGTPSFRLNRREQATSNVFPAGCMGSKSVEEAEVTKSEFQIQTESTSAGENGCELKETDIQHGDEEEHANKVEESVENYVWKRNPLTGEGVEMEKHRKPKKGFKKKLTKWIW